MRKHLPASLYDTPAIETWLEDMARKGFRFTGFSFGDSGAEFEKAPPEERRYCLEPLMKDEPGPDKETRELYARAGWEHAANTRWNEMALWRSTRLDPRPIHTDPEAAALAFKRVAAILRRRMALYAAADVFIMALLAMQISVQRAVLTPMLRSGDLSVPVNLLLVAWSSAMEFSDFRTLRVLRRRLKAGVGAARPAPYGRRLWFWRVYYVLAPVLIFAIVLPRWSTQDLASAEGLPIVAAGVLGAEAPAGEGSGISSWSPLASRYLRVRQGGGASMVHTEVFDLRWAPLAPWVLREVVSGDIRQVGGADPLRLADARFDDLRYLERGADQYLAARLGKRVLYVRAEVPEDLRDHLDAFAAAMAAE